ncbi:hypothetical protein ACHAXA_011214 [Cyclostephanos tholiformis]|uniref:Suppressor of forked domain-containing protein n=1 Tax=Cyclostephanos tholiformis TaxID=382380 RepID=A0ABD3RH60_9STRA
MSESILLEDDDDAMFGDGDEEEEEEDDDVVDVPTPATTVKMEAAPVEGTYAEAGDNVNDGDLKVENGMNGGAVVPPPVLAAVSPNSNNGGPTSPLLLPTSLPSTSPFPHHNAGPTSDRLRNAMSRIATNPAGDAEAWQALITEAQSCYRTLLPSLHRLKYTSGGGDIAIEIESELVERKLDWIEACYGALLHHFPYAVTHYVQLVEMLLRLGALTPDEEEQCGPAGGIGGAGGGSALSDPALATPDQGVASSPASLLMHPFAAAGGTARQRSCDDKIDGIFRLCLGVGPDGSPALHGNIAPGQMIDVGRATAVDGARTIVGGLARHSVDLWLLYVRWRSRDAARSVSVAVSIPPAPPGYVPGLAQQPSVLHRQYEETLRSAYRDRKEGIRDAVVRAYESALDRGAGFSQNNHLLWKRYVNYVKSWTDVVNYAPVALSLIRWYPPGVSPPALPPPDPAHDHYTSQRQLSQLRSIYQRGITHPMTGLDQFWQEYEIFERSHSESLGSVLIAEYQPRYQHARSIYLERNRVWTARELMVGRLAVPPVGYEGGGAVGGMMGGCVGSGGMGSTSRGGLGGTTTTSALDADDDFGAEVAHGGTGHIAGMSGGKTSEAEYVVRMEDELRTLSRWRRRAAYERTNPERLNSSELAMRVRASFSEEVCAFARHPEVWYEWSQWELLHGGSTAAASASSSAPNGANGPILGGGGASASSAALIAPAVAGEWKSGGNALRAIAVLTLGMESLPDCALLALAQAEILERHLGGNSDRKDDKDGCGMGGCIEVLERYVHRSPTTLGFVLLQRLVRRHKGVNAARAVFGHARRTLKVREEDKSFDDENESSAAFTKKKEDDGHTKEKADGAVTGLASAHQRMVTNRLKASVGALPTNGDKPQTPTTANGGFITWHLYTAHAIMEHRLGKNPNVAARIYELGLRKHRTFLSNPQYVLHYANLLLELKDEENLRSLLMRAVAACEEEEAVTSAGGSDAVVIARKREMQRPLWDMMLKFESILSSHNNKGNILADISSIEARRRRALYGPNNEDVVMGGDGSPDDDDDCNLGTGIQKSSLNEQLTRVEGYDVASRIANGMGRLVDVLTVTGAIGNGDFDSSSKSLDFAAAASASLVAGSISSDLWGDEYAGGPSDVSFVKRLRFQRESRTRAAVSALGLAGSNLGTTGTSVKLLSSRERTAGVAGQAAANALALQNIPEWLRPLLLLLPPVAKFGRSTVKPPPHHTEMALSTLRANPLPASRPVVTSNINSLKKRGRDDGDSSDDENGDTVGGGHSSQFRSRQRMRLLNSSSN